MGQKSNPIGLRLGINRTWDSIWFDDKNFADRLKEDLILRKYILNKYATASVAKIIISRTSKKVTLTIHTARPGLVIGKGGTEVDLLKKELKIFTFRDLLFHYPFRYIDKSKIHKISGVGTVNGKKCVDVNFTVREDG